MPGVARIFFGLFWIVVGFVVTGLSYMFPIFDQFLIWYGAWIFGGVLVVWGIVEALAWKLRGEGYRTRRGAMVGVQTLVDAMCFVARADGEASDVEIATMHRVLKDEMGFEIDIQTVRERVKKFNQEQGDFLDEIGLRAPSIPADFKHEIVRAVLLVAFADGSYKKEEAKACSKLVIALAPLPPQTEQLIHRVFNSEEEKAQEPESRQINDAPTGRAKQERFRKTVCDILRLYPRGLDNLFIDNPKLQEVDVGSADSMTAEEVAIMASGLVIGRIIRQIIPNDMRAKIRGQLDQMNPEVIRQIGQRMIDGGDFDVPDDDNLMFGTIFISWALLHASDLVEAGLADAEYLDDFKKDVLGELETVGSVVSRS